MPAPRLTAHHHQLSCHLSTPPLSPGSRGAGEELPAEGLLPAARPQGVYLRLDIPYLVDAIAAEGRIPLANVSTAYALYTDADVMFTGRGRHRDVSTCTQPPPQLIRLSPQHARGTAENSGVLLFNVSAWKDELPAFVEYGRQKNFRFGAYDNGGWVAGWLGGQAGERVGGRLAGGRPGAGRRQDWWVTVVPAGSISYD